MVRLFRGYINICTELESYPELNDNDCSITAAANKSFLFVCLIYPDSFRVKVT